MWPYKRLKSLRTPGKPLLSFLIRFRFACCQSELERDSIYFHYPNYAFHKGNRLGSAIRSGDYKLIKYYDDDSIELYLLKNDISESRNIAEKMPGKAKQLRSELDSWLKKTNASQPQHAD